MGSGRTEHIYVQRDDNDLQLASEFCNQFNIGEQMVHPLAAEIRNKKLSHDWELGEAHRSPL